MLDIKTTMHPARHLTSGIRQLLGYLLLDYANQHSIAGIGLYLAQQGSLHTCEIAELLPILDATAPLQTLPHQCAEALR